VLASGAGPGPGERCAFGPPDQTFSNPLPVGVSKLNTGTVNCGFTLQLFGVEIGLPILLAKHRSARQSRGQAEVAREFDRQAEGEHGVHLDFQGSCFSGPPLTHRFSLAMLALSISVARPARSSPSIAT
jgi:hypothetical protein